MDGRSTNETGAPKQPDVKKKAVKRTTGYTVMLIPDSTDNARSFELTFDRLMRWGVSAAAVVIVVTSLLISSAVKNYKLVHGDGGIKAQIAELENENAQLSQEKEALNAQVASLNMALETKQNEEQQAEEAALAEAVPTGLPLDGTAVLIQDPNAQEGQASGRVVFTAMSGTAVVAAGSGTVTEVASDADYGNVVVIDHGNGYQTAYRTAASIRVKTGAEVRQNEVIGVITEDDGLLAYEIVKDGAPVEPLEIMEIAG